MYSSNPLLTFHNSVPISYYKQRSCERVLRRSSSKESIDLKVQIRKIMGDSREMPKDLSEEDRR